MHHRSEVASAEGLTVSENMIDGIESHHLAKGPHLRISKKRATTLLETWTLTELGGGPKMNRLPRDLTFQKASRSARRLFVADTREVVGEAISYSKVVVAAEAL